MARCHVSERKPETCADCGALLPPPPPWGWDAPKRNDPAYCWRGTVADGSGVRCLRAALARVTKERDEARAAVSAVVAVGTEEEAGKLTEGQLYEEHGALSLKLVEVGLSVAERVRLAYVRLALGEREESARADNLRQQLAVVIERAALNGHERDRLRAALADRDRQLAEARGLLAAASAVVRWTEQRMASSEAWPAGEVHPSEIDLAEAVAEYGAATGAKP